MRGALDRFAPDGFWCFGIIQAVWAPNPVLVEDSYVWIAQTRRLLRSLAFDHNAPVSPFGLRPLTQFGEAKIRKEEGKHDSAKKKIRY